MAWDEASVRVNDETQWEELPCPICGVSNFTFLFKKLGEPFVRCNECSLVMINPRPVYGDIVETYDKKYGQGYADKKDKKLRRIRPWVRRIKKIHGQGRWLDIGCSVGFVVYAAKEAGFDAYGVDVEPWGLDYARKALGLSNIAQGHLEDQGYPENYFSVISMYDVIEHVPDLNGFVSVLKRLLASDGILDIRTPDVGHWRVPKDLKTWQKHFL